MLAKRFPSIIWPCHGRVLFANHSYQEIFEISHRNYRPATYAPTIRWRQFKKGNLPNRHWNPKFAHMRVMKVIPMNLSKFPSYDEVKKHNDVMDSGPEAMRSYLKEQGIPPARPYKDRGRDRPLHVSSTGGIFEAYVPPEGDGRASRLTREGVGQLWDKISSKSRELIKHVRTVRRYDEEFDPKTFGENIALPVFTEAHQALANRDIERMHELVTEHAFAVMYEENRLRTVRWELIESIEPCRVVHVRATGVLHEDNVFGQVTVRLHTKQKLAIYDQFGRLYLGSKDIARDVLEYVVFERHLVDPYGAWRMHTKITPKWLPPKQAIINTFKKEELKKHDVAPDVQAEEFVPVVKKDDEQPSVSNTGQ